ncbi:MAG: iron ABC transporter permease [Pseudomonadales bacterium]|nr:iron ABC transporter permease [Pseudomonadales bacterium]
MLLTQWATFGDGEQDIWRHLLDTKLDRLTLNTLLLLAGVGALVTLLGASLAWLVSLCDFPGRRWFDWALMLPLSIPGYVMAFVFYGLFSYSGPLQSWGRATFGANFWFPDLQGALGVILVMSLALYPYVYLLARAAFKAQGRNLLDAARLLGHGPRAAFWRVALPVARPALIGGVALAAMETLADFGAVSVFNYDTFTTAIYNAWSGLFNLAVAAQLASLLLVFVALTLLLEHYSRKQARFTQDERSRAAPRFQLSGIKAWGASLWCALIFLLAFGVPLAQLLLWVAQTWRGELDSRYPTFLLRTLELATLAALATVALALLLAFIRRLPPGRWQWLERLSVRLATLGYALPGSVLAVGIIIAFTALDQRLQAWLGGGAPLLVGSVFALILAYLCRFMAVAFTPLDSALERIKPSLCDAARSLGAGPGRLLRSLYLPLLRPGFLTALIIVFVDVMKEMPATLIMRPFDWDTLAVRIYQMTAEGQWERAALPALTLLVVGLIPVLLLVRQSGRG